MQKETLEKALSFAYWITQHNVSELEAMAKKDHEFAQVLKLAAKAMEKEEADFPMENEDSLFDAMASISRPK